MITLDEIAAIRARLQERVGLWHNRTSNGGMMDRVFLAVEEADADLVRVLSALDKDEEPAERILFPDTGGL